MRGVLTALALLGAAAPPARAQVLFRLADSTRLTYSELHEGLRPGTPAADSALAIVALARSAALWRVVDHAVAGRRPWNDGLLALTRLAERGARGDDAVARRWLARLARGVVRVPPGRDADDLASPLRAVQLGVERRRRGDAALLGDLVGAVTRGEYGVAEAWTLGRLDGAGAALAGGYARAATPGERARWLALMGFCDDPGLVPLLAAVHAAPDSAGLEPRLGARASDALLWVGTREAAAALLDARARARARGSYDMPALARGGYDFLANDSSLVVSRTGRWLTEWVARLR